MASTKPVVLVTGGNTGLGLAVVKSLCESDHAYEIVIGSRSVEKGEQAIGTIKSEVPNTPSSLSVVQVDLVSDESISVAAKTLESKFGKLDVLVNNGGQNFDYQAGQEGWSARKLWNTSWDVNVTGTQVLTEHLVPLLIKSNDPRLLFVTSGASCLTETQLTEGPLYGRMNGSPEAGWPKPTGGTNATAYRSVKTGLNMMMRQWYRVLKNDNVKVWAVSPGFLATGLAGVGAETLKKMGAQDPSVGGNFIRSVIEGQKDDEQGKIVRAWPSEGIQDW